MENNVRLSRALPVLLPLLLSGCLSNQRHGLPHAIGEQLAANAINYNLAMEKSQNEMMLLNVIRAMQHRPLYLTDTAKVTGTINGSFTIGLSIPWGKGDNGGPEPNKPTVSPSVTYSTSPSMDVSLLDSQDFMAGFLKPIPPELFAYYWQQGWLDEFLLYMLVLNVDEYRPAGKGIYSHAQSQTFYNHPVAKDSSQLKEFADWVSSVVAGGRPSITSGQPFSQTLYLDLTRAMTTEAPEAPQGTAKKSATSTGAAPKDILGVLDSIAKDQSLSLAPFPGYLDAPSQETALETDGTPSSKTPTPPNTWPWTISAPSSAFTLLYQRPAWTTKAKEVSLRPPGPQERTAQSTFRRIEQLAALHKQILVVPADPSPSRSDSGSGSVYVLTLRSPEGVLYYLGQLARFMNPDPSQKLDGKVVLIHSRDIEKKDTADTVKRIELSPLFVTRRAEKPSCRMAVSLRTAENDVFAIPDGEGPAQADAGEVLGLHLSPDTTPCTGGQSMHALSLLSQLISLQKSAKDFPTTSTVKVVGQ